MKKKSNFAYDWLIYTLITLISIGGWIFLFKIRFLPKAYEKLDVFYGGIVTNYKFQDDALNALKDKGVLQIELASSNPIDTTFQAKYQTVGLNNSDIVIVTKEIADKTAVELTFKEFSTSYNRDYYIREGKNYGIYLNPEDKNRLSTYFTFTSDQYVILVNENSVNSGTLTTNSYSLIEWMVNYNG